MQVKKVEKKKPTLPAWGEVVSAHEWVHHDLIMALRNDGYPLKSVSVNHNIYHKEYHVICTFEMGEKPLRLKFRLYDYIVEAGPQVYLKELATKVKRAYDIELEKEADKFMLTGE